MKYEAYFKEFCKKHGYLGKYKYNAETKEYDIIISKGSDNAGAFLAEEEYKDMSENKLNEILIYLHSGFKEQFNK